MFRRFLLPVARFSTRPRRNREITSSFVALVEPSGTFRPKISLSEALHHAASLDLDLVEVDPAASPPVCRLLDYDRLRGQQRDKEREKKHEPKTKEVRFVLGIAEHDLQVKLSQCVRVLEKGDRVKLNLTFPKITDAEEAQTVFAQSLEALGALVVKEGLPGVMKHEGVKNQGKGVSTVVYVSKK
jgi:translation initiation factor IF-3